MAAKYLRLNKENKMKVILILAVLFLFVTFTIQAQVKEKFEYVFDGGDDYAADIVHKDGYVYVIGTTQNNSSNYDYVTMKLTEEGQLVWKQTYGYFTNQNDFGEALAVDNDGNVYVTGKSQRNQSTYSWHTKKYNKDGVELWNSTYFTFQAGGDNAATHIAIDYSGNIIVAGTIPGTNSGTTDYAVVKYNSNTGNQIWTASYNGPGNGNDFITAMTVGLGDHVLVTGASQGSGSGYDYATVFFHSSDGSASWVQRYNGTGNGEDWPTAIDWDYIADRTKPTYIYVTGRSRGSGGVDDYLTIQYSYDGQERWVQRYWEANSESLHSRANSLVASKSSQYVVITGWAAENIVTLKYDVDGNIVWHYSYDGGSNDFGDKVVLDDLGGAYIVGGTFADDRYRLVTLKYNLDGASVWEKIYDNKNDFFWSSGNDPKVITDSDGEKVFVLDDAFSDASTTINDIVVLGYSDTGTDWCNVQWPPLGTINQGEDFTVYAQSWVADYPGFSGAMPGLKAWIGVSKVRTNPAGWHITGGQWIEAEFNEDKGNNDEFMAEIGSSLQPGTYYYASRFQLNSGEYSYGGYGSGGGGFWDDVTNKSGVLVVNGTTSVEDDALPTEYSLEQNYPNPFNPSTTIKIGLPEQGLVSLKVYNVLGEQVAQLVNKELNAGYHEFNFDASNLPSGIYIYQVQANGKYNSTQKMMLVK